MPKNLLIDCDPGMDDGVALMLALRHPAVRVLAVTAVTGNLTADRTSLNARKVLAWAGAPEVPVAQGPLAPLRRGYPSDPFSHGTDGLGDLGLPDPGLDLAPVDAPRMIVDTVDAHAGDVTLVCLGPLTNLALALELDPGLPAKVREVVVLGGAFGFTPYAFTQATGDNPASEWNFYVDPDAARAVLRAGLPLTAVGLDVTTHPEINLSDSDLRLLEDSRRPEAAFLAGVTRFVRRRGYQSYCALIDSVAVASVIDPGLLETESIRCDVETEGELTRGMTVVDVRNHHAWEEMPRIKAAKALDFPRFRDLLLSVITGEPVPELSA
ncbi:MAG: nucleoside hydrolase [Streptosporangiales bacterium]|nr:nucleoside hydrolase [Streptosporangiales bacterium]